LTSLSRLFSGRHTTGECRLCGSTRCLLASPKLCREIA
jgi:hypothetical protein